MQNLSYKKDSFGKYEIFDVKSLKEYKKNSRSHSKEQIEELKKSICQFGFTNPVLIDENKVIIAGHARLKASKELGIEKIPTISLYGLTDLQKSALVIADNKLALNAGWDENILKEELTFLKSSDFDLSFTGFSEKELLPFFPELKEYLKDEDDVPEITSDPICKLGDIWILGNHRLMCGDSTLNENIISLTINNKIDLLLTDPPYGMNVVKIDGNIGGKRKGKNGYGEKNQYDKKANCGIYKPIIGDDKPFDPSFLLNIGNNQIIFGANHFSHKLPCSPHWLVWNKNMPHESDFSGAELAWTSFDKKTVKVYDFTWAGMTRSGNRKEELIKRVHPTQKPVGLFLKILENYESNTVLDLFGGSGSVLIACEKLNRTCFMMELDPHYCDVIIKRWEDFTGKKATKEN